MGTILRLPASDGTTVGDAWAAFPATLAGGGQANTRRAYASVLRRLGREYGTDTAMPQVAPEPLADWFTATWGDRAPSTWNVALDALRSAARYWADQGWITGDPSRLLRRRKPRPDRDRALSRDHVEQLLTRDDVPPRDRLLWANAVRDRGARK